jgi:hypothetical protein
MFSTFLDLLGFAAFVAATYLLAGPVGGLYVAGAALLITGAAVNDEAANAALGRLVGPLRARVSVRERVTAWRAARRKET